MTPLLLLIWLVSSVLCWFVLRFVYDLGLRRGCQLNQLNIKARQSTFLKSRAANVPKMPWPAPTPTQYTDQRFQAIWTAIRSWDIYVPEAYLGICEATGNHVIHIMKALDSLNDGKHD